MIHLHSAATAQQTCNINFSVVFRVPPLQAWTSSHMHICGPRSSWSSTLCCLDITTDGSSPSMLFYFFFFFFVYSVSCKSVRYTLYTPTQNILALVCARALNSWTCMCREHAPSVYFPRGRVSARKHIHTCISSCQASHELCSDRSQAADWPVRHFADIRTHCQLFSPNSLMSPQCLHRLNQYVRLCNLQGDLFLLIFTYHRRPGGMTTKSLLRGKKCNGTVNLTF